MGDLKETAAKNLYAVEQYFLTYGSDRQALRTQGEVAIPAGCGLWLAGWALGRGPSLPSSVEVLADGEVVAIAESGGARKDYVVEWFDRVDLRLCGFSVAVPYFALNAGPNALLLRINDGDGMTERSIGRVIVGGADAIGQLSRVSERFALEVRGVSTARGSQRSTTCVRGSVVAVDGRVRDLIGGEPPSRIDVTVAGCEPWTGLVDQTPDEEGWSPFRAFFPTESLNPGSKQFSLCVRSSDGFEFSEFGPMPFELRPAWEFYRKVRFAEREAPAGVEVAVDDGFAYLRGWAIDASRGRAFQRLFLEIDGDACVEMASPQYRPDIAERFAMPKAAFCGFVGTIDLGRLRPGRRSCNLFGLSKRDEELVRTDVSFSVDA